MAEKLHFSLVAPERELVNEDVDQVDVPGAEGEFGVLPHHAPVMAIVKPGALRVYSNGAIRKIFVNGGFADVTPAGLTVLAEDAVDLADVDVAKLDQDIQNAREDVSGARDASAQLRLSRLEAMKAALAR
ncbi:MAG TPA: F0F1 ATP synthase subunit epsilon [Caulobacterales bacterium]|nr:F0F1 ATP synthase subunit epsilon [Caulobacterales bacterium]